MTPRPWSTKEIQVLKAYAGLGARVIALILDRSISSVEHKAAELKLSLVQTGDDFEATRLGTQILDRLRQSPFIPICPTCGVRLAIMHNSGLCRVCHLDALILDRETKLLEIAKERKLTKLRQDKRRLKVCDKCGRPFFPRLGSNITTCQECQ